MCAYVERCGELYLKDAFVWAIWSQEM